MDLNFSNVSLFIFLAIAFSQFPSSQSQSSVKLAQHYKDQEKACQEFDKCMAKLEISTGAAPSSIKLLNLGDNVEGFHVNRFICSYKTNCRREHKKFCDPHLGPNGTVEMKIACLLVTGSQEDPEDAKDPILSKYNNIEDDQQLACSNYKECMELPNERINILQQLPKDEAVRHILPSAKHIACSSKTNCRQSIVSYCDAERAHNKDSKLGKIFTFGCALTVIAEEDDKNTSGSRSLGGGGRKSQEMLSEVCPAAKDGVCAFD